jgi:WhiB family transcriptional regulator, redox-sensing transcriptional regulator
MVGVRAMTAAALESADWRMAWHPEIPGWDMSAGELEWQDAALCAQADPDAWFPAKGGNVAQARAICSRCPVRRECLEYALGNYEQFGIWAGTSARQRLAELAAREPGVPRCESGWHPLRGSNLTADGTCRMCSEVRSARSRTTYREARSLAA